MLTRFRLVAIGVTAFAAYARALDASNFTNNEVDCGTPGLSPEQWVHFEESLAKGPNITRRQQDEKHRIPTHITVLSMNSTVEGGNIPDIQIEKALDQVNKFYSYGFVLDSSVDTIHRYTRPDLFDPNSGIFTGDFYGILGQYHRGEGDYASLNIIFLFHFEEWCKTKTTTTWGPDGSSLTETSTSGGGALGMSNIPKAELWHFITAMDHEKKDGLVLSSAILPDAAHSGCHATADTTLAHEFGHWVGLKHTDDSNQVDAAGVPLCDPVNDGIDDTPAHILDLNVKKTLQSCPPRDQVNTCQHLDSRPDPVYNLMISTNNGCESDGLTDGQMQRTLEVYNKFRKPYKQQMQQKGLWVQPQGQTQQDQLPQNQQPQNEEPKNEQPQNEQPQNEQPQSEQPQNGQGDWQQQELTRVKAESNQAWDTYRQERAKYLEEIEMAGQRNFNDCLSQVQQEDEQNQQQCRQIAQEEESRTLQYFEAWDQESLEVLQGNDNIMKQYLDSLSGY